ncbi:hypothetical protein AS156_16280 [Bradyrhizobium macuxiense]|uniref:Uncharacterized protein n=1 Tax=Bradyrhizobium macuxiense TaxID=1755647 RepID=A0A120FJM4_9BRAD|nr:hypothetical protein [Bradyrhizobium macuxiense]KWV49297.1 hypothetical protein AS156_16280 [Bradyrhizobium macuxiense]
MKKRLASIELSWIIIEQLKDEGRIPQGLVVAVLPTRNGSWRAVLGRTRSARSKALLRRLAIIEKRFNKMFFPGQLGSLSYPLEIGPNAAAQFADRFDCVDAAIGVRKLAINSVIIDLSPLHPQSHLPDLVSFKAATTRSLG